MNEVEDKIMNKKRMKEIRINKVWCKGCGICVHFCPQNVLGMDDQGKAQVVAAEHCICCMMCELRCPDLAIEVIVESEKEKAHG